MRVNNFQFQTYGDENLDSLMNPNKVTNGLSIFVLLSKCLELADRNGDSILSETELNIFRLKNSSDILKEVQGQLNNYDLNVDTEELDNLMNKVKELVVKNNEIKEETQNLEGMSKEDFLKKAEESAQKEIENQEEAENEGQTEVTEENPAETSENTGEIPENTEVIPENEELQQEENTEETAETPTPEEVEQKENADELWKLIYYDGAEEIFDKIDTDRDGILSKEELDAISGADDDNTNISITDLSDIFSFGYYDDIESEYAEDSAPLEDDTTVAKAEDDTTPKNSYDDSSDDSVQKPSGNDSSSSSVDKSKGSSSGGSYDSGANPNNNNNGGDTTTPETPKENARTKETIEAEIKEQENNKETKKQEAKGKIEAQEQLINQAIEQSKLSEQFKQDYNNENTRLQGLIDEKDTQIEAQKGIVQDLTAQISSYTTSINDISSQITNLEGQKPKTEDGENSETAKDLDKKIENLRAEKERLEGEQKTKNDELTSAKQTQETLEKEKTDLQNEKDNILTTLEEKYSSEKDEIEAVKSQIETYKNEIKTIQDTLKNDIEAIDKNIETLKTEKENLVQKEKTDKIIAENSGIDSTPYAITGDIKNFNWESIGYNKEVGHKLATEAYNYAHGREGNHGCLGGVNKAFKRAYGYTPFEGKGSAYMAAGVLENDKRYREVTGIGIEQLKDLPEGALVIWSKSSGSSMASKHGHASISLGNGYEASDHICKQYRHVGSAGVPRVWIPIADLSKA